jgi:hypothetical protein
MCGTVIAVTTGSNNAVSLSDHRDGCFAPTTTTVADQEEKASRV